jgi:hypothetical protein
MTYTFASELAAKVLASEGVKLALKVLEPRREGFHVQDAK